MSACTYYSIVVTFSIAIRIIIIKQEILASLFLLSVLPRVFLVDARSVVDGVPPKGNVKALQERVEPVLHPPGRCSSALYSGNTFVYNDAVGHGSGHDEIVLDEEAGLPHVVYNPSFHDFCCDNALLAVEASTGFINEVDRCWRAETNCDGQALHLSAG